MWVLHRGPTHLLQVPALKPDSALLTVQLQQLHCVRALPVHTACMLQRRQSRGLFLTPSILLTDYDP